MTMRDIDRIVIYRSATPEGDQYTAADIDRWHRARGWSGIGYHAVIQLDARQGGRKTGDGSSDPAPTIRRYRCCPCVGGSVCSALVEESACRAIKR